MSKTSSLDPCRSFSEILAAAKRRMDDGSSEPVWVTDLEFAAVHREVLRENPDGRFEYILVRGVMVMVGDNCPNCGALWPAYDYVEYKYASMICGECWEEVKCR